ncbi:unnamed protein product [Cuscuta campestris]|uniref:Uncharacterized protein n=1 Tax=Cuscuta campestris TaxID=132261 RepID=A0A484N1V0_9ASTE|nr:unnamed protein product [Cuscuta campestris]
MLIEGCKCGMGRTGDWKERGSATSLIDGLEGVLAISIIIGHKDRRIRDGLLLRRVVLPLPQQRWTKAPGGEAEPNLRRTLVFVR